MTDRHEEIALRAYRIWEDAGRPDGQELEHWTAAEAELQPGADVEIGAGSVADESTGDGSIAGDDSPMATADDESAPPAVTKAKAGGARRRT